MNFRNQNPRPSAGFSLIEVLLATMVLAAGTTGISLLLLGSVQGTVRAEERSQAALQASELAQLIHANPAVWGHLIEDGQSLEGCATAQDCTASGWAGQHFQQWQRELQGSIAAARGLICRDSSPQDGDLHDPACDGQGGAVVKIIWREAGNAPDPAGPNRLALPLPQ